MMWLSDSQKIGVGLIAFGTLFTTFGVLMFFDGGMLAMGNLMFLAGITLVMGYKKTGNLFLQRRKWKGTLLFFLGILMIFFRWPKSGIIIESFGFLNLFGDFFPTLLMFLKRLPVVGRILAVPGIKQTVDRMALSNLPL